MAVTKKKGLEEIYLLIQLENEGVDINPALFKNLDYKNVYLEQIRSCFDWNFKTYVDSKIPSGFRFLDTQFYSQIFYNPASSLKIIKEDEKYYLAKKNDANFAEEIQIEKKPAFYNKFTSDKKDMSRIVQARSRGRLDITYSNECSLKDKGLDCLFCNINYTKSRFEKLDNLEWKNPRQIGETIAEAYREGYHGFNLTGGFIPERREVEYYIDVIEAVRDYADIPPDEIHGMACVGAPSLETIENYKEAGYQHIATNMEVWDENMFKYICPGKEEYCGGRKNWILALKNEVEVFGKWNARSLFVGGLETKESLLEGVEFLTENGVVVDTSIWKPCIGSALEGHRSPETDWHIDLLLRQYTILKKYGVPYEHYYWTRGDRFPIAHLFQLDGGHMSWEQPLEVLD